MIKSSDIISKNQTIGERNMRKNFGAKTWLYPMPVLIIGTYDENGNPNAMNAAWGGIYDTNLVMVCLADDHKTTLNIKKNKAFTSIRKCTRNGVEYEFFPHLKGNIRSDFRVHFAFIEEERKILICHFGEHLDNAKTQYI